MDLVELLFAHVGLRDDLVDLLVDLFLHLLDRLERVDELVELLGLRIDVGDILLLLCARLLVLLCINANPHTDEQGKHYSECKQGFCSVFHAILLN